MAEPRAGSGALVLALLLAGCGGGETAKPAPEPATEPATEALAPAPAPAPAAASAPAAPVPPAAESLLPVPDRPDIAPAALPPAAGPVPPDPAPGAPDIYMALQSSSAGTVSVVFAIDEARDNTPSDDPAIRLTPENGKCNPQELRRYEFPAVYAARPIYSAVNSDIDAAALPAFLSTTVTTEMLRLGLAGHPDDTRPQNMCSFLLWRELVHQDLRAQFAGQ